MSKNIPQFTIREMLESGVHYGHKKNRWNPQMSQFIYGSRGDVHIIDLTKTYSLLQKALQVIYNSVQNNGKILFVGTKKQLANTIENNAKKCNQYYVNHRWLGGMLTNWTTVSNSLKTLSNIEKILSDKESKITKKERLNFSRKHEKLNKSLGGIRELRGMPSLVVIFDTIKEANAIREARKLGIPIIAIVDTNSSLQDVTHPIPGNDDSAKAVSFFCNLIAETIIKSTNISAAEIKQDVDKEVKSKIANTDDVVKLGEDKKVANKAVTPKLVEEESKKKEVKKPAAAKKTSTSKKTVTATKAKKTVAEKKVSAK